MTKVRPARTQRGEVSPIEEVRQGPGTHTDPGHRKDGEAVRPRSGRRQSRGVLAVELPRPNALQRVNQRLAATRPLAFVFRHTFHRIDLVVARTFGGRTLSGVIAGLPNILLTTTGARTGQPRTVPLVAVPVASGLAVIATRFGSPSHPDWYYNLVRDPRGSVQLDGAAVPVVARLVAEGAEYDAVVRRADREYAGYRSYRRRITRRHVPAFVLEPASGGS